MCISVASGRSHDRACRCMLVHLCGRASGHALKHADFHTHRKLKLCNFEMLGVRTSVFINVAISENLKSHCNGQPSGWVYGHAYVWKLRRSDIQLAYSPSPS